MNNLKNLWNGITELSIRIALGFAFAAFVTSLIAILANIISLIFQYYA